MVMPDPDTVPDGWRLTTLGALGRYINGRAFKSSEWSSTGRPIIRIQDLTGSNRNPHFFDGAVEKRYMVRKGDLLVSWSATLGAYIWDGPEAVLNQHIFKVESSIDKRLHYHLIRKCLTELYQNAHGSGMVHVTKGLFDDLPVKIPADLSVQAVLAAILDKAEKKRSISSEHLAVARKSVEQLRQAILMAACSGRLTADWRAEHPEVPDSREALAGLASTRPRRARDELPLDLALPDLPPSYFVATIGDVATAIDYGTNQRCDAQADAGVPVLRMGNIQDGELDLSDLRYCAIDAEIERLLLANGDLLFNRTNSPELVGKTAVFHGSQPTSFASYLIRVRFAPELVHPEFVNYWLNSAWGRLWAYRAKTDGVSQSNINSSKLALMAVPLPPVAEQLVIVERTSATLTAADHLLHLIEDASRASDRTFRAVLAQAFNGRLTSRIKDEE
jgi:type I restriction enzyme S subunit